MNKLMISIILVLLLSSCANKTKPIMQKAQFTEKEILRVMDSAFNNISGYELPNGDMRYDFFLDLEDTRMEVAGSKIHLYADSENWAVVFETNGFSMGAGIPETDLVYVGNCIKYDVRPYDSKRNDHSNIFFHRLLTIKDMKDVEYVEEGFMTSGRLKKDVNTIKIKGKPVTFKNDYRELEKLGITIWEFDNPDHLIDFTALMRYLHATQPEVLWATEKEIKKQIKGDIPKVMDIDQFHFTSTYNKIYPPSYQELFELIARVLVTRDPSLWQPTEEPNNHWSNWESGF